MSLCPNTLAAIDGIAGHSEVSPQLTYEELYRFAERCALQLPLGTVCSGLRRGNDFYVLLLACSFRELPFVAMSVDLPEAKRVAW